MKIKRIGHAYNHLTIYNQVKFTNISKVPIKGLNIVVYYLERDELIIFLVAQRDEVKARIATEDELVISPFKKVAEPGGTPHNIVLDVFQEADLILFGEGVRVVLA